QAGAGRAPAASNRARGASLWASMIRPPSTTELAHVARTRFGAEARDRIGSLSVGKAAPGGFDTTLKTSGVQLWFLDRAVPATPEWFDVLDPTEQARAAAFGAEGPRAAYIAAHALVRTALSAALGAAPETWRFEESPHGRPSVVGSPVRFNLSHAGPNVAVALCEDHDVGLDLESVHPQRAPLPLA